MALADFDAYRTAIDNQGFRSHVRKTVTNATGESILSSSWTSADYPPAGAAPTTAVALDYSGALGAQSIRHPSVGAGRLCLVGADTGDKFGTAYMLIDRLSHMGGLSGTSTSPQTTNLPTAALPRYTDGTGVMIGVQVYTTMGSTDSVLTISYTNTTPTAGRTAVVLFSASTPSAGAFYIAGLQGADTGVTSVESATLSLSTGTAGNFGITLFKPLAIIANQVPSHSHKNGGDMVGWNTPILDEAHLELLNVGSLTGQMIASLQFAEV